MEADTSLKKVAKGAGLVLIGLLISKALNFFYRVIAARTGIEDYGLFSLGLAVFGLFSILASLGTELGVFRYVSYYLGIGDSRKIKGVIVNSFKISLPLSLLLAILLFIFSDKIAIMLFNNARLGDVLKIIAFIVPFDTLRDITLNAIKGMQRIKYDVYSKSIADSLVKVILAAVLVYLGYGVFGVLIAYFFGVFVSFILAFYFLQKKVFPLFNNKTASEFSKKRLLTYSLPLMIGGILTIVLLWTDTLMIGYFRKVSEVGIYNAAVPLGQLMLLLPTSLVAVMFPVLTEIYAKKQKDVFNQVYKSSTKWLFVMNMLILLLLLSFADKIISIFFGYEYLDAVMPLMILSSGFFLFSFMETSTWNLWIHEKTRHIMANSIILGLLNIILNLFLIPAYGIIGAAISTAMTYITNALLVYAEAFFISRINPLKLNYLNVMMASLILFIIIKSLKMFIVNIPILAVSIMLVVLFYFLMLLLTKTFERNDVMIMKAVLNKIGIRNNFITKLLERFS